MKKLYALVIFLFISYGVYAQSKFDGDWRGSVTTKSGSTLKIRIKISDDEVTQYFWNADASEWRATSPAITRKFAHKNNFEFSWMSSGGVWTETQTFMLSYVSGSNLSLVWSRQVVNEKDSGDNEAWAVQGEGSLSKY